jgi:hypothetical protein
MKIKCGEHGEVEWQGDVVCVNCKQIYFCEGSFTDEFGRTRFRYPQAPDKGLCKCGKRLFGGTDFTMRPTCRACAVRAVQSN